MNNNITVAIVYVKRPYINPSEKYLIDAIGRLGVGEVSLIDITPLFLDNNNELLGILLDSVSRVDCLFLSNYVLGCVTPESSSKFYSMIDGKVETVTYVKDFISKIYQMDKPKIVSCMLYDIHDPDFSNFVQAYGKDGILITVRFSPHVNNEIFTIDESSVMKNKAALEELRCVIESPHCISKSEFLPLNSKKIWRVAVPGVNYRRRMIANESLNIKYRLSGPPFKPVMLPLKLMYLLRSITGWAKPEFNYYKFANAYHLKVIGLTEMVYTDGGMTDYAVRKFFEIPAAGSLLLCTPFNGMKDLGFIDGVTHIECEPEDVGKLAQTININSPAIRSIITAGQELIRTKHSADARASQVLGAMRMASKGNLSAARWIDGEFVLTN